MNKSVVVNPQDEQLLRYYIHQLAQQEEKLAELYAGMLSIPINSEC